MRPRLERRELVSDGDDRRTVAPSIEVIERTTTPVRSLITDYLHVQQYILIIVWSLRAAATARRPYCDTVVSQLPSGRVTLGHYE